MNGALATIAALHDAAMLNGGGTPYCPICRTGWPCTTWQLTQPPASPGNVFTFPRRPAPQQWRPTGDPG